MIENGPGMRAGLRVYEDFIIAVDGLIVEEDEDKISEYLKKKTGQYVKLVVWNCLDEEEREVLQVSSCFRCLEKLFKVSLLVNEPTKESGYLGVIVRYESLFHATEYVWHVISVVPNSPADEVGKLISLPQLNRNKYL